MKPIQFLLVFLLSVTLICCQDEPKRIPTVFTVGDSTVKNGRGDGADGLWGWGDFLAQYLDSTKIKLENHALGGTSSRTYIDKGLWDSVQNKLRKGDYVLIQFGHNDDGPINDTIRARGTIKGIGDETQEIDNLLTGEHEIVHSYGWYLNKIVEDTKRKGAIPILVSPIPRNKWMNGKVPRNNNDYGLWVEQIADEERIGFIDLNEFLAQKMESLGEKTVTDVLFYEWDHTHTSAKGAALAANIVASNLVGKGKPWSNWVLGNPKIVYPEKRSIFLIGDSTMADNGDENAVGWGVPFIDFVDTLRVNLYNKARGGRSSRTFMFESLWDSVKTKLRPKDFVILQFGHNDAGNIDKAKFRGSLDGLGDEVQIVLHPDGREETVHTFGWYMRKYIQDSKALGAEPIVMSLTPRNEWPNGKVEQRYDTYIKWAQKVAAEEEIAYIDLSDNIAVRLQELGRENVMMFFPKDHTHTSMEGATFNAGVAAESLSKLKGSEMKYFIINPKK